MGPNIYQIKSLLRLSRQIQRLFVPIGRKCFYFKILSPGSSKDLKKMFIKITKEGLFNNKVTKMSLVKGHRHHVFSLIYFLLSFEIAMQKHFNM